MALLVKCGKCGQTRTNAELSPAEKDAISHRGKAFRALASLMTTVSV